MLSHQQRDLIQNTNINDEDRIFCLTTVHNQLLSTSVYNKELSHITDLHLPPVRRSCILNMEHRPCSYEVKYIITY